MKITAIYIIMIAIISISVLGATTIQSEDFESYSTPDPFDNTARWNFFSEANGEWDCFAGSKPTCRLSVGSGGDVGEWSLKNESGNKYMHIEAGEQGNGNYFRIGMFWNNWTQNSTYASNTSQIVEFDFRVQGSAGWTDLTGSGRAVSYAGIYPQILNLGGGDVGMIHVGGNAQATSEFANFSTMRPLWDSGTAYLQPLGWGGSTFACDVGDGQWHTITTSYYTGGSCSISNITMYIDGVQCDTMTEGSSCTFGNDAIYGLVARAWAGWSVDFDNLKLMTGDVAFNQCNDNIDNDGDGFTDYPDDPSCTSLIDNSESPFDYVQCNNGIDDDLDGFIDYPDDPSCSNSTDTTEEPADFSQQEDDACLEDDNCLLKDTFTYTDDILLHGWEGTEAFLTTENIFGSNRLFLGNLGTLDFDVTKNISNPNLYDDVTTTLELFFAKDDSSVTNETIFLSYLDADDRELAKFQINLEKAPVSPYQLVTFYLYNGTDYDWLFESAPGVDEESKLKLNIQFDQVLKEFYMSWQDKSGSYEVTDDEAWSNVLASKLYKVRIDRGTYNSNNWGVWVDNILFSGVPSNVLTSCDTWTLPYYLRETFTAGYANDCDWLSNLEIYFTGQYQTSTSTPLYYQQKSLSDTIDETKIRYATLNFDANIDEITTGGSFTLRLYDSENFNFFTTYFIQTSTNGHSWWYNEDGTGKTAKNNITLNQSLPYKIIIDMQEDTYDMYFNGSLVVNDADFTDNFYNLQEISTLKLTSSYAGLAMDNLEIYASTADGTQIIPDDDIIPIIINETMMCGYIYKEQPKCLDDSDCASGKCLVTKECSRLDANYCTENGWEFGNRCFLSATTSCAMETATGIMLDNFLWVIVFIIIMMGLVYFTIMMRGG